MINKSKKEQSDYRQNLLTTIFLITLLGGFAIKDTLFNYNRQKYYIEAECRYTIATYGDTGREDKSYFYFEIATKRYREYVVRVSNKYPHIKKENLRLLVRYNIDKPNKADIYEILVPDWVLAPPENGWIMFPPDINWAGAVIDSTKIADWQAYKQFSVGKTDLNPWFMKIPDTMINRFTPEYTAIQGTSLALLLPENYKKEDHTAQSLSFIYARNDSMAHIRISERIDLDYAALIQGVKDQRASDTICDNCFYEQSFVLNSHAAHVMHYYNPETERNYMYLFIKDEDDSKPTVVIDANYSPGVYKLKDEVENIVLSFFAP